MSKRGRLAGGIAALAIAGASVIGLAASLVVGSSSAYAAPQSCATWRGGTPTAVVVKQADSCVDFNLGYPVHASWYDGYYWTGSYWQISSESPIYVVPNQTWTTIVSNVATGTDLYADDYYGYDYGVALAF